MAPDFLKDNVKIALKKLTMILSNSLSESKSLYRIFFLVFITHSNIASLRTMLGTE